MGTFNGNSAKAYFDLFMEKNGQNPVFVPRNLKELERNINQLWTGRPKRIWSLNWRAAVFC